MNKPIIGIISGVVGIGIGGAVGYILGKKSIMAKCTKEIEEMGKYYEAKAKADGSILAKQIILKDMESKAAATPDPEASKANEIKQADLPEVKVETLDYTKFYGEPEKKEPTQEKVESPKIYLIDEDAYDAEDDFISNKKTVLYYKGDGVLTDDGAEIVSLNLIGGEELIREGLEKTEGNLFFVRNEDEDTDYEVVILEESYAGDVLGQPVRYVDE